MKCIPPSYLPVTPGLDKEEPELSNEEDIPKDDSDASDDGVPRVTDDAQVSKQTSDVQRE